jgi:hypothetical protein
MNRAPSYSMCAISGCPAPHQASTRSAARWRAVSRRRRGLTVPAEAAILAVTRPVLRAHRPLPATGLRTAFIPNGTLDMSFDAEPSTRRAAPARRAARPIRGHLRGDPRDRAAGLPSVLGRELAGDTVEFSSTATARFVTHADRLGEQRGISNVRFPAAGAARGDRRRCSKRSDALLVQTRSARRFRTFVPSGVSSRARPA